jgi:putative DNA primase/helicase
MAETTEKSKRKPKLRLPRSAADILDIGTDAGRTDASNAERFVDAFQSRIMYVPSWGRWLHWDGARWHDDNGVGVRQCAKLYAKRLWAELARQAANMDRDELGTLQTFCKQSNQVQRIRAFIELAESDKRVVCQVEQLNQHPTLLNVKNGTVDLESGELRKHDPADRMTQVSGVEYDASATCPQWEAAVDLIFDHDAKLVRYFQQLLGYSCSGLVDYHVLPMNFGPGGNGKSLVWNVVATILGDYAKAAPQDLLCPVKGQHPEILAGLYQKRFVAVAELDQGRHLAEAAAKMLTGGDIISARRMYENSWDYVPTAKIWLSTNHKPKVSGTDPAIWRRIRLIPFAVDIASKTTPKPGFAKWLTDNEGPGILNWLLAGFRDYRQNGMMEPEAVKLATSDYRAAEDSLGEFLRDYCVVEPKAICLASSLFEVYQRDYGGKWTKTEFGKALAERFAKEKQKSGPYRDKIVYFGVRVAATSEQNTTIETTSTENTDGDFFEQNTNWDGLGSVDPKVPYSLAVHRQVYAELVPTSPKADLQGELFTEPAAVAVVVAKLKPTLPCRCGASVECVDCKGWRHGRCGCGRLVQERLQ